MKIALIGASGQLGTDLQKVIPQENLINLDYPDFDIIQLAASSSQLSAIKPDLVINTAAYNLVDRADEHPKEAMAINYQGVVNLVEVCLALDIPLIHFSTDYVFGVDKKRKTPYTELDQTGPLNQYGKSKLLGEQIIQEKMKKYFIFRTAYLFGSAGSQGKGGNIVEALIKKGTEQGELVAVTDQIITPTYALDLAQQVWQVIQTDNYGLFHAVSQGNCSIYEFVQQIFEYLGKNVIIKPIQSSEFNLPAARPKYSVLANQKLIDLNLNIMRPWRQGLKDYLIEKKYIK